MAASSQMTLQEKINLLRCVIRENTPAAAAFDDVVKALEEAEYARDGLTELIEEIDWRSLCTIELGTRATEAIERVKARNTTKSS